jgi:23S rRNA (guanine745-N1)-methyltransferase
VLPPLPRAGHRLLRCPIWRLRLDARAGALACPNRHSFDLAREGYVNLLPGSRRRPTDGGDHAEQLQYRRAFLDAGHFDPITAEIAGRLWRAGVVSAGSGLHVLDAGCGTGHHLASIAKVLGTGTTTLGLDISAAAARIAARRRPEIALAVADLWSDWPLHDASILELSIFAPRNFAETARVLRPGGWLALIYPEANHLIELRRRYRLLGQRSQMEKRYSKAVSRTIGRGGHPNCPPHGPRP